MLYIPAQKVEVAVLNGYYNMGLEKAIEHGKEKRKIYYGAKAIDRTCRNHGSCLWCNRNRTHRNSKKEVRQKEQLKEYCTERNG